MSPDVRRLSHSSSLPSTRRFPFRRDVLGRQLWSCVGCLHAQRAGVHGGWQRRRACDTGDPLPYRDPGPNMSTETSGSGTSNYRLSDLRRDVAVSSRRSGPRALPRHDHGAHGVTRCPCQHHPRTIRHAHPYQATGEGKYPSRFVLIRNGVLPKRYPGIISKHPWLDSFRLSDEHTYLSSP